MIGHVRRRLRQDNQIRCTKFRSTRPAAHHPTFRLRPLFDLGDVTPIRAQMICLSKLSEAEKAILLGLFAMGTRAGAAV